VTEVVLSIALKGRIKKDTNRNFNPVQETLLLGKAKAVTWVKVGLE